MNWHKLSPAVLTVLIFILTQLIGFVLFFVAAMLLSPDIKAGIHSLVSGDDPGFSQFDPMVVSSFALSLMVADTLAVLVCYFPLRYVRILTAADIASINWKKAMLGVAAGIFGAFCISFLEEDVELPDMMKQLTLAMSHNVWGVLALAIIGPIAEELLFREAIEGEMLRRGASPWTAIIVSALAFGIMHLNLAQGLYAIPLGILLGIIYYKTGNIVVTSLLHILNNSIAALQLFSMGESYDDTSFAEMLGSNTAVYALTAFCGLLCIVFIKVFWDSYRPREEIQKNGLT